MRFTVQIPAEADRFAADAFAGNVGKAIRVTGPGGRPVQGTVVEAQVHPDGTAATVTIEVEDGSVPEMEAPPDQPRDYEWSIGYRRAAGTASVELAESVPLETFTVAEAAEFLGVSQTYLLQQLGELEHTFHGPDGIRISGPALRAYKVRDDARRRAAATELTQLTQELGLE